MMRLVGQIGGEHVVILVDMRNTHNIIDPTIVQRAKLKVNKALRLIVKVANRVILPSEGFYLDFSIKIQGIQFSSSFYILKLGGCGDVLRVNWLERLGLIVWNFVIQKFEIEKGPVELKGFKTLSLNSRGK